MAPPRSEDHGRADTPRLLIPTRHFRGLSGKVILLRNNIPAFVQAGWRVLVYAEKLDEQMVRDLGAEPHRIHGRGFGKSHKVRRFIHHADRFAQTQGVDLVAGHGDTLNQDILHIHSCRHREYEEMHGQPLKPGRKATADLQARQLTEGRYRRLVANSAMMRDDFVQRFGIDPARVSIVHPGHDPARFHPDPGDVASRRLREELGVADGLLVGLITSGKLELRGADLMVAAAARLPEPLRQRLHLLLVGSGDKDGFMREAARAGLADRLHCLSPVTGVETLYRALDVYVNPARFETFSMSVLEAMACGVPSVTTRKVGISELYTADMQDGLMSSVSAEALADCLANLLVNSERRAAFAGECQAMATPLTWAHNTAAHLEIYRQVLAEKQAEGRLA